MKMPSFDSVSYTHLLMPDDIVPTASGKTMKSGYGVKTEVRATLSTDAPTSHITYPQTAFSVFPEFQYQTYLRLLQRSGGQSAKFIFKPNEFSTYDQMCIRDRILILRPLDSITSMSL